MPRDWDPHSIVDPNPSAIGDGATALADQGAPAAPTPTPEQAKVSWYLKSLKAGDAPPAAALASKDPGPGFLPPAGFQPFGLLPPGPQSFGLLPPGRQPFGLLPPAPTPSALMLAPDARAIPGVPERSPAAAPKLWAGR